jgi:hypothetical protein
MAMHLTLIAQQGLPSQPEATIQVAGDVLTIDGTAYDLSPVPEGGEGRPEGDTPFVGPITRSGGVIHATVIARLGDTAADFQPPDPAHWIIPDAQGPVTIPAIRKPVEVTP